MSRSKGRPMLTIEQKLQVVLSVLAGEVTMSEAARRNGVAARTVGIWRDRFIEAGKSGLEDRLSGPDKGMTAAERRLRNESEQLKLALAEATVQLRIWQKGAELVDQIPSRTSRR